MQISEKYDALIENTKQSLTEGFHTLKEKISLEELKKTISTMNWVQLRVIRSSVSFRRASYSDLGNKMRHALSFHKRKEDVRANTAPEQGQDA